MKNNWRPLFIFIIIGFMAFTSNNVYAKANDGIDVVLVMDSSGSMKKTDPMSLRIPASKLFISLLNKNDRASVVSFSDTSYPIIQLTPVDSESNKEQLLKAADKIRSAGLFTNLYDALAAGQDILSKDEKKERPKIIVLMSDGMMDVGDTNKDRELVDKIRNEMATALEEKGIKVYAIAFTEQSDRLLLEKISKRTGGFYNLALSDNEFHLIFTSIFESLKSPDMLPMSENGFLIDGSIEEVTIVATKGSPQTQISLNSPDGRSYSNKEKSTGIGWVASDNFDMITIKTPVGGKWEILFSTGENNKAYIITNLKLQTNFDQLYSAFGDPLDIKIWLEKDGITIKEKEVLNKFDIYIELSGPDGKATKLKPFNKEEGIFVRNIAPFTPGNYKMRIVAQGNTFEREKAYVFNIADAKESKEDVLLKRGKEKKVQEQAKHSPVEDSITSDILWKKVIIQFVSINLAIGIFVFVYIKRKNIKAKMGIKKFATPDKLKNLITREKAGRQEEEKGLKKEHKTQEEHRVPQTNVKSGEEIKQGVPEKQAQDTIAEAKEVQKDIEERAGVIEQKEDEAQIKEIPLEEEENEEGAELGEEKTLDKQESDTGEQKEENLRQEITEETEIVDDNQWRNVESNQQILNQDDLNELLGMGGKEDTVKDKEEQITDLKLEDRIEGNSKSQEEAYDQEKTDNDIQNEEAENLDDLWQKALQTQKDAEAGGTVKGQAEQTTVIDVDVERLEKSKKEDIGQLTDKESDDQEKTYNNIRNEEAENLDDLWQEALQTQKDAEAGGTVKGQAEQTTVIALDVERLEKEKKEDISQLTDTEDNSIEVTGRDEGEDHIEEASGEKIKDNIMENMQEDVEALWLRYYNSRKQQENASGEKIEDNIMENMQEDGKKDNKESLSCD